MAEASLTAVLTAPGTIVLEERAVPEPAADEVLVEVRSVGVCGSDTHYFEHGRIGRFAVEQPLVLGHESSGVVVAVGSGVDPERVGQRVSLEPGVPCRACEQCAAGRYNLCPRIVFHATPPVDGSLTRLLAHHHSFAHPVPDHVSDDAAALVEPLSVGLWACRRGGVRTGSRVLVTGAGPVGLLALQAARVAGATDVVLAPGRTLAERYAGRGGPEVLLECSGHPGATVDALGLLAPAGTAVLVGMGSDELPLPVPLVQERELWVTGVFRYAHTWPTAIALVASGAVRVDELVTGHFPLAETARALTAARDDARALKSVIRVQE